MKINLSNRAKLLGQSDIRAMSLECEKVKGINLSQGVSDLPINPVVEQAAKRAIEKGINHYTRYDGLDELRQAIAGKLKRDNILEVDADKNIIVSSGATGALYSAFLALLNPGDEIIILEPFYGYHLSTVLAVDLKPVFVSTAPPDWKIDFDRLEKSISSKTKGIIICTPANPSGKVFTSGELKQIGELVIKHDLLIFTDEIYEYFLYDGNKHVSPFSFPEFQEKTIMVSGYSKTFSITGWRIGYLVCDERYKEAIGDISDLVYVCAPAPLQTGVAQGIEKLDVSFYDNLKRIFAKKRDKICAVLDKTGLTPYIPQGAYYVLSDVGRIPGRDSREKAMYILRKTGVATVPGRAFYHGNGGDNLVRICFAKEDKVIDEACERLLKLKL